VIAGGIGAVAVTPVDVIKTRFQMEGGREKYKTLRNTAVEVFKNEGGLKTLFKGSTARACVVAPLFGISLLSFELQKEYIRKNGLPKMF